MVPIPRESSRRVRRFRKKNTGETSPTKTEIRAGMVERSFVQVSPHSLPGSVPSGPPDGLVTEPLCQEDTCHRSEHKTSHQNQSRISKLNRIWDDRKSLLADRASSLKDEQNIALRIARTGRNWLCTTMVGWEMSRQESVAPWCYHRSMSMTSNSISRKSGDGHPPITSVAKEKSRRDKCDLANP